MTNKMKIALVSCLLALLSQSVQSHRPIKHILELVEDIRYNTVGEIVDALAPMIKDSCCCQEEMTTFETIETTTEEYHDGVGLSISLKSSQDNSVINNGMVNVSLITENGSDPVAEDVPVDANGNAFIQVFSNGEYAVSVQAPGFFDAHFTMEVDCYADDCISSRLVAMSPELESGQTAIILTWVDTPSDLDIHIMSVNHTDGSYCKTWYANKNGCQAISLDLDNESGGMNGAETMTLLDASINQEFAYLIGVEDYYFSQNGALFLESGAAITITNGNKSVFEEMVADSITFEQEWYLFGCVIVSSDGDFTYFSAPEGTFFDGSDEGWLEMYQNYCD